MDDQVPSSPPAAEPQSIEDYIATENTRERTGEPSAPDATPEPLPPAEPPPDDGDDTPIAAAARNADGTFKRRPTNAEARHDPKARVEQQTWDQREAERRAEAATRRAEEAERRAAAHEAELQRLRTPAAPPQPVADPSDPEPDPDDLTKYADGQFDRQYLKDQARWEARQEFKTAARWAREREEAATAARTLQTKATTFHDRISPAMADPAFVDQIHPRPTPSPR